MMMMMTIGITFVSKNITIQFTIKSSSLSMNGKTMIVCVWGGWWWFRIHFIQQKKKQEKKKIFMSCLYLYKHFEILFIHSLILLILTIILQSLFNSFFSLLLFYLIFPTQTNDDIKHKYNTHLNTWTIDFF